MRFFVKILLCVSFFLLGCDSASAPHEKGNNRKVEGFIHVSSTGKSVVLEADDESSKNGETTKMKVSFDYDFYLQKHEVTCGEFVDLIETSLKCENDNLPVVNVNYYDAVLYANAKSKRDNLDTVYTYVKMDVDGKGHCSFMEGLVFHPEIEGYRLPTEAEWVFAASEKWNVENSWTADDEINGPRPVCSKKDKDFCDLEGNVTEWVNDWLGSFKDTSLVDFVGSVDGGSLGERVIKGGSFRNQAKSINTLRRGDTYVVTSKSRESYVGFRLALGSIPNALWLSIHGTIQNVAADPMTSALSLRKFSGAYKMKLVFRNDVSGNLSYVNFANAMLPVVEIMDTIDSFHPDLSPDGKWVAFCTKMEGVSGKSDLYVRELENADSKPVKLDVKSGVVPRWRILENGDTVIVYVSDAGNNEDDGDFFKESTWQVKFSGGKFGTPEKMFDGAYHGGVEGDFAVTGSRLLRAHLNSSDTVWYDSEQACNVSLSKSGDKRVLFLDFGNDSDSNFVGKSYGVHERLLITDSTGLLIQSIASPKGYSFDHTERVAGDLIIASLTNSNGNHSRIAAVRPSDSTLLEILEGNELWHPCLWVQDLNVDVDESLNLDSAAVYSVTGEGDVYLQYKLPMFWSTKDSLEIVGVGNSRMSTGFCSKMLDHSLNMATVPCDIYCSSYLIENYVLNHCPKIKYVLVSLDLDLWKNGKEESLDASLGTVPGFKYDRDHDFWKDGLPRGFVELSNSRETESENFQLTFDYYAGQFAIQESNGWVDEDGTAEIVDHNWDVNNGNAEGNFKELQRIVDVAKEKGVYVVGIVFPLSPYYKETDQYGRHGLRRTTAESYMERLREYDVEEKNFVLMDENKMGDHDYPTSMSYDCDHLNYKGSRLLAQRLDSLLKTLE